jgi:uncharacterized membrane protein
MTLYEKGYALGQAVGFLLVAGVCAYFLYRNYKKKRQKKDDGSIDQL